MSPLLQKGAAVEIFYSYSHQDEALRDELEKQLSILKKLKIVRTWHDRKICAGHEWADDINDHLNTADIILLLISADFLASEYCYEIELDRAMKRHEAREARVIPIILRDVDWRDAPFGKLQALPSNAKPVTSWPNRDEAFADVARGIRATIEALSVAVESEPENISDSSDDEVDVPRLLPYLCNRSDQETELCLALQQHQQTMPRRPFVCIIHGDEFECHSEFLERIKLTALPGTLNLEPKHLSLEEYNLVWPSRSVSSDRYAQVFASNLGASLVQKTAAPPVEIVKYIATHEKPLLITSHLLTEDFLEGGTDLLAAFLEFWNTWPDLPPGRTLINCVCLKHQRSEKMGFLQKWKLQRLDDRIRIWVGNPDLTSYRGLFGVVLAELQAIRRSDVEAWTRNTAVRALCEIQDKKIRELFQRQELCTPDGLISMEMLADELRELVRSNPNQRN